MLLTSDSIKQYNSQILSSHSRLRRSRDRQPPAKKPSKSSKAHEKSYPSRQTVIGSRIGKTVIKPGLRKRKEDPAPDRTIRVFVNNRLGTKAEILCSPSDSVGDFKMLAAMRLGLKVESIMLKRQGQRPLKDRITLQDYEIGCGSSLDLELDTGD